MTKKVTVALSITLRLIVLLFLPGIAISQLHADFSAAPLSGCPPVVVNFKDLSTGNPASWFWDLGNGTTSTSKSPFATYIDPGKYTIKLVIKSANGVDSIIKNQLIVINALPVPLFSASDSIGCFPLKTRFADGSRAGTGTITAWEWDFGDGTLSAIQNPVHTYTSAGNYTVTLKITNSSGCSNFLSKPAFIKLQNGVKADFSYSSAAGCHTPAPVNFANLTKGTGTINYKWDFGDGNFSSLKSPVNNYQNAGVYTVKLIASTSFGCADTMIKPNAINIGSVKAGFTKPDTVCAGSAFQITNTSNPSSFVGSFWDFGDGTTSNVANPLKAYALPGNYLIKSVIDFGSCRDSVTKKITALGKPAANFSAINNNSCKPPLEVTFNSSSTNIVSYKWNFGDTATSTLQNPVHTYTTPGIFPVTLIVTNSTGCTDTLVKKDFVKIVPPKIMAIKGLPAKGWAPVASSPGAVMNYSTPIAAYFWDFGDGSTSTLPSPNHNYTTIGSYNIKLKITTASGCTDTLTVVNGVKVGTRPSAQFSGDTLDLCAAKSITFKDKSTGAVIDSWYWTFGDGKSSTDSSPVHKYSDTGYYTVSLAAFSNGCSDTITKKNYVFVEPPIARFDTGFLCSSPLTRNFIDKSVVAQSWQWNFGDSTTASGKNVSHTYATPGTYQVALYVTNGVCKDTAKASVLVLKQQAKLQASDSVSCVNTNITFTVNNIDPNNNRLYSWYLYGLTRPATVITGNNIVVNKYQASGTFAAAAILTNILNCQDTIFTSVPIKIYGPKASFGASVSGVCVGNIIKFSDSSSNDGIHPINNWIWNFGDGNTTSFTTPPFAHRYDSAGIFGVGLTVVDSYGCRDSVFKPALVNIAKPVAAFSLSDTLVCPKTSVTFTNSTAGANNTYLWKFGDGKTSAEVSPAHIFQQEGKYGVKLIVTDQYGCADSVVNYVNVVQTTARFSMSDSLSSCPPFVVNFTNTSKGYTQTQWDFGDSAQSFITNASHIYTSPGTFHIKLLVQNNGGCADSITKTIIVRGPNGDLSYTPTQLCAPGKVNFIANVQTAVKFLWDYQEGNPDSTSQNVSSHVYNNAGLYIPRLIVEDASGCRFAISGKDTISVNSVKTKILTDNSILCDSGTIHFSDSTISSNTGLTYNWVFGDGSISSDNDPLHTFNQTGIYNVKLKVSGPYGCSDTTSKVIKVVKSPAISILAQKSACAFDSVSFAAQLSADTSSFNVFSWNFGNGQISSLQVPPHQFFNTPGNDTVRLSVANSSGCISSVSKPITIIPVPQLTVSPNASICIGNSIPLSASGAVSYSWQPTNANLSCTSCANPVANPLQDITYKVKGTSAVGCSSVDSVLVKVFQPFHVTVSRDTNICAGSSVQLFANGAPQYLWIPAAGLNATAVSNPVASPAVTTTYQVIGYDTLKCRTDTNSVIVTVYKNPVVSLGADKTVPAGTSVVLQPVTSTDVTGYQWLPFNGGLSCIDCATPQFIAKDDVTYKLKVSNEHCSANALINIKVTCNNIKVVIPNAFSPNGDGINDVFFPTGNGAIAIKQLIIYNRWGQQLFGLSNVPGNNPTYGWNGTSNGKPVDVGVYYYYIEIICANEQTVKYTGNITLLK